MSPNKERLKGEPRGVTSPDVVRSKKKTSKKGAGSAAQSNSSQTGNNNGVGGAQPL